MKTFGQTIRELRLARRIGLNEMAARLGVTGTYLSQVERNLTRHPPSEGIVTALAAQLDQDPDMLLALAERISSDLPPIIRKHPVEMAAFLRTADGLSALALRRLTQHAEKARTRERDERR